jgi:hypothetical protein
MTFSELNARSERVVAVMSVSMQLVISLQSSASLCLEREVWVWDRGRDQGRDRGLAIRAPCPVISPFRANCPISAGVIVGPVGLSAANCAY